MSAAMRVTKWQVEPAKRGDIKVSLSTPDSDGTRHAVIEHAGDYVWVAGEDIPALIAALQAAASALKAE